ncbi:MAG: M18 family aminopeptidase, partial [Tannerellaceae bacterium]
MEKQYANKLIDFIASSPTNFHAVETLRTQLKNSGYTELSFGDKWTIEAGGKYF